ncbi:MAG TPA: hypothetical protein VNT60_07215 [Deinococcales bacterium]|nr:hypothetical protein [Deinococcales bacterium]
MANWDSDWYYLIARRGYFYDGNPLRQQNVAFFPAFPLASGILWKTFGGAWSTWALAISWICHFCFLAGLHALARAVALPAGRAEAAVWLAGLSPPALFGYAAYPTSLIALSCTLALLFLQRRAWLAAGLAAGLATASGSLGIAAAVVVSGTVLLARAAGRTTTSTALVSAAFSFSGVAAFSTYLWWRFGDPLAYASVQAAWQKPTDATDRLLRLITLEPVRHAVARLADNPVFAIAGLVVTAMAVAAVIAWRRLPLAVATYTALALILAFLASAGGTGTFGSLARIAYSATPAYLALALLLPPRAARLGVVVLAAGFALFAYRFGAGHFVQ